MKRLVYLFKYCKLLRDMKTYGGRYDGIYVYECPKCNNMMVHSKTIECEPWLRPTFKQMLKLSPEMIEYVLGGGLILKTHLK